MDVGYCCGKREGWLTAGREFHLFIEKSQKEAGGYFSHSQAFFFYKLNLLNLSEFCHLSNANINRKLPTFIADAHSNKNPSRLCFCSRPEQLAVIYAAAAHTEPPASYATTCF